MEDYHEGIPRLSAVLTNETTSILRGYFTYAIRALLYRQHEIGELIEKLDKLDAADAILEDGAKLKTFKFSGESGKIKKKLLQLMDVKINKYCKLVSQNSDL